jgi:hypothetical protein
MCGRCGESKILAPVKGKVPFLRAESALKPRYNFAPTHRGEEPLAFAGLWDTWQKPDDTEVRTYTIITCEPDELMALHSQSDASDIGTGA